MTLNYSKADDQALASSWFPEATRPFKYEIRKKHYNYDTKQWCYGVFKSIENAFSIEMTYGNDSLGTAEGLLEMAKLSGDVEKYFSDRLEVFYAESKAKQAKEYEAKLAHFDKVRSTI
jgi:hypothetical protein